VWLSELVPVLGRLRQRCPALDSPVWPAVVLLALLGAMLPKSLEPLHANRNGFRDAGSWLAEHSAPWDGVIDPYGWAHYYAGKVFLEGVPVTVPAGVTPVTYVVLEGSGNEHTRLPLEQEARRLSQHGQARFHWRGQRGREIVDVLVYALPPGVR
jgi:hypothetical protein